MQTIDIEKNLSEIRKNKYLVIVEGKKDKETLVSLNIKKVTTLKNRPLFEVVESIEEKEVVILTDLDQEGRKLFNKIRYQLQRRGIKINNKLRNNLFKTKLNHIEGLSKYLNLHKCFII